MSESSQSPAKSSNTFQLNPEGEELWQQFRTAVDWSDSFELFFLFSGSPPLMQSLGERLQNTLSFDNKSMQTIKPEYKENLTYKLLSHIFPAGDHEKGLKTPVWLDLTALFSQPDIINIKEFLSRLNERRERLRKRFALPFIIVLPESMLKEMPALVPDLWSIRNTTYTFNLVKHTFFKPTESTQTGEQNHQEGDSLLSAKGIELTLKEWRRLVDKGADAQALDVVYPLIVNSVYSLTGDTLANLQHWLLSFPRDNKLSIIQQHTLHDSLGLIWRTQGKLEKALAEFTNAQKLAQQDLENTEGNQQFDVYKQRSLYIYLLRVADIQVSLGGSDAALGNQQQALEIARTLQKYANNSAESIEDTYYALARVANVQSSMGDKQEALENFQEALSLARQVQQLIGDTPKTLRNISVTLERIADIQVAMGQQQNAMENYQSSLEMAHQIQQLTGDTPNTLRYISVYLIKVASIQQAMGQYSLALENYQSSLEIAHQIQQLTGDSPQALRDISVSLYKLSVTLEKSQQKQQAISYLDEALDYRQKALELTDYKDQLAKECKYIEEQLLRLKAEK